MPVSDSPKGRTKAVAAKSEQDAAQQPESKKIEFEGLELELAPSLPAAMMFDLIETEASEGGANAYLVHLRLLRSLVGPDQFMTIRHRIGEDVDKVWELINLVLAEYGMGLGESPASQES